MLELRGLSEEEARKRLEIYGKNVIERRKKVSPLKIFLSQFTSPLIILLIIAAFVSLFLSIAEGESFTDTLLIFAIVLASGIAGFVQDYKAEKAIEALQKLATPVAKVIRDGELNEIPAPLLVPGDVILVEGGDIIPADAKILEGEIEVDESLLTGESTAVVKRKNSEIYSGCSVYTGRAYALVLATGMQTKIGKIASKMQEIEQEKTPFQEHMEKFTKKVVMLSSAIIALTFLFAFPKFGVFESLLIAIALAVAAIPEGLPAVITLALSLGAREMAKRKALIRRLAVTESIGCVDVICTDKTGTLTQGKMKVRELWLSEESEKLKELALKCCFYCNSAKLVEKLGKKVWEGDETDIALKQFSVEKIEAHGKKLAEIPFSSTRKYMAVAWDFGKEKLVLVKGAPEIVAKMLAESEKAKEMLNKNKEFASRGLRVIALAYKEYSGKELEKELNELRLIGLIALSDAPREGVREALQECYEAGIRVIMLTGDHALTAKAIAKEIGLKSSGVLTGEELEKMSDEELEKALSSDVNIFARVSPFHKLRILELLQKRKRVVAMTGDGVNDALALKKADVGIAMGLRGSEVAKEASDIILLDDNFASIRNAVKEGRRIFDNIRKFVDYLLTCNVAEVLTILLGTIFFPYVLLYPVQILWINLVTDGLPAIALAVDPARHDIMRRKPRKREEGIINKKLACRIALIGIEKSCVLLLTFLAALSAGLSTAQARSVLFTGFVLYEFVRIGVIRYNEKLASLNDWLANRFLVFALLVSLALQLLILYSPLAEYFSIVSFGFTGWAILLFGTVSGFCLGIAISKIIDKFVKE